jgi:hypothetical protein
MHKDAGTFDGAMMFAAVTSKDSKWPKTPFAEVSLMHQQ